MRHIRFRMRNLWIIEGESERIQMIGVAWGAAIGVVASLKSA